MREKLLVTDPMDPLFAPKTLESFLSQKRTAQTGFHIAARFTPGKRGGLGEIRLWHSKKYGERINKEFVENWPDNDDYRCEFQFEDNGWRWQLWIPAYDSDWEWFKNRCIELGYDLTPVRSFRRFTR